MFISGVKRLFKDSEYAVEVGRSMDVAWNSMEIM